MKHIVVLLKNSLLLICMSIIIFTACNSRKERIEKQINILYSNKIDLPFSKMEAIVYDSMYLHKKPNYRVLVYLDSTECTSCYVSHYHEWESLVSTKND